MKKQPYKKLVSLVENEPLRKLVSAFFLIYFLTLSSFCTISVSAEEPTAEPTYMVTITESDEGHIYRAYQIFSGSIGETTVDGKKQAVLSNITAGTGLKTDADTSAPNKSLVTALLKSDELEAKNGIKDLRENASAKDIAEAIDIADLSSSESLALAKVLNQFKSDTTSGTQTKTDSGYEISGLPGGYYLICDEAADGAAPSSVSSLILRVLGNEEVQPKTDAPQVVKKVYDPDYKQNDTVSLGGKTISLGEGFNDVTDAAVCDDVTFEVISTLPENYESYDTYYYAIVDDLDASFLPYTSESAEVNLPLNVSGEDGKSTPIDDTNLHLPEGQTSYDNMDLDPDYRTCTISYETNGGAWQDYTGGVETAVFHPAENPEKTRIMAIFTDLRKQSTVTKDTVFKLSYQATLEGNAKTGNEEGNQNTAKLSFSNNPENPASLSETPKDLNVVYTYEADLHKISSKSNLNETAYPIPDVPFAIYQMNDGKKAYLAVEKNRNADNKYIVGGWDDEKESVDPKTDNEIYDGSYQGYSYEQIKNALYGSNKDFYRNLFGLHSDEEVNQWLASTFTAYSYVVYSDANGELPIKGLDAGIYYLEELETPNGYKKLSGPIRFQINPEKKNTQNLINSTDSSAALIGSISGAIPGLSGEAMVEKNGTYVEDSSVAETGTADASTGIIPIFIKNHPISVPMLPVTGGHGTRIFYLFGLGLIGVSVILLVMKKRKNIR